MYVIRKKNNTIDKRFETVLGFVCLFFFYHRLYTEYSSHSRRVTTFRGRKINIAFPSISVRARERGKLGFSDSRYRNLCGCRPRPIRLVVFFLMPPRCEILLTGFGVNHKNGVGEERHCGIVSFFVPGARAETFGFAALESGGSKHERNTSAVFPFPRQTFGEKGRER